MSKKQLSILVKNKNIIGLHSHHHFPNLKKINYLKQFKDYKKNYNFIKKNFRITPSSASYPFGRYNSDTIKIMKNLKIKIAFLSKSNARYSNLSIGRIDHANLLKNLMKTTIFTSNSLRHLSLINKISSISKECNAIVEVKTLFPGFNKDFLKNQKK